MQDWLVRDSKAIWHPFTPTPHLGPRTVITRAKGAYVFDAEGKSYFDATSSWWCNTHGHCHPKLVEALTRQAATLDQILFSPHTHSVAVELSELILQKLGADFTQIFFSDDGSTAVEAALKMAIQFWKQSGRPERHKFLSMDLAYHGDTLGAVSVSQIGEYHHAFSGYGRSGFRAPGPYCYRCPIGNKYPECAVACLDETEKVLAENEGEIAALIVEPLVLGAAGMVIYPREYLERLVRLAKRYGILVIYDEVFTGFGRTGTLFAMDQVADDCRPDIVCLSKGLTGGMMPMAVTVVNEKVRAAFRGGAEKTFFHGHTFTANALGCAVALAAVKIFDDEKTLITNRPKIAFLASQRETFLALPHVGDVRTMGMIFAVELVSEKTNRTQPTPPNRYGWKIAQALWDQGIWIRPLHNMIYLVPPYCVTETELRHVMSLLHWEIQNERHYGN